MQHYDTIKMPLPSIKIIPPNCCNISPAYHTQCRGTLQQIGYGLRYIGTNVIIGQLPFIAMDVLYPLKQHPDGTIRFIASRGEHIGVVHTAERSVNQETIVADFSICRDFILRLLF